jgi:CBS domain-containing protein
LVFEFSPRSFLPICLSAAAAAAARVALVGGAPVFAMPAFPDPSPVSIAFYLVEGLVIGLFAVIVTRAVYWIEDRFDELPIHWMWWPPLGAIAVGIVGYFAPRTLGVGYDNIDNILSGTLPISVVVILCTMKLLSWSISLGSGTSGGTLAPLFTIGGGLGAALGAAAIQWIPSAGADIRVAALVGMAGMFAGASRALLASIVFAFETTRQPLGLLPLLAGCTAAHLVSCFRMKYTIMTEKIERRGVRVPSEYGADFLNLVPVREAMSRGVVSLRWDDTVESARRVQAEHQGFPVLDADGRLLGIVTRRDLLAESTKPATKLKELVRRSAVTIFDEDSLRTAADLMAREEIGRLPVVTVADPLRPVGMLTRSDVLGAHERRLKESHQRTKHIKLRAVVKS